jgi:hypothetical protein
MLLRALIAWNQGDRHVWSVVRVPSVDEEDLRRSHRERDRLVRERTAHINRIKGLLFGQGIRGIKVKSEYRTLQIDKLITGDGRPFPPRLASEITRARKSPPAAHRPSLVRRSAGPSDDGPQAFAPPQKTMGSRDKPEAFGPAPLGSPARCASAIRLPAA